jgi:hypothetical protein
LPNPFKEECRYQEDYSLHLNIVAGRKFSVPPPPSNAPPPPPPPPTKAQQRAAVLEEMSKLDVEEHAAVNEILKGRPLDQLPPREQERVRQVQHVFEDLRERLLEKLRKI